MSKARSAVAITQNIERIERAIREALRHVPLERLVRDKLVAVKPNDTWANPDDITGVTQADTLRAVLREIKQYNPGTLVVTGGAGAAETEDVFRVSGMLDVIRDEGAEFFDHNRAPFTAVELEYPPDPEVGGPQRSVMVNPRILEYETLIALNQLKLHRKPR